MGRRLGLVLALVIAVIAVVAWSTWPTSHVGEGHESSSTIERATTPPSSDPFTALRRAGLPAITAGSQRLEGQVVDADERPVAGATVTLGGLRETLTEADGMFAFDGLAEGDYAVAAIKLGAYAEDLDVRLSETSDPIVLALRAGAMLTVHVVAAESGVPIAGAKVATTDRSGLTNTDGTVALRAIDRGREPLDVSAPGRAPVRIYVASDDPRRSVERTIELAAGAAASGRALDPDGRAVADARVLVETQGGEISHWVDSDERGRWSVPLLPAGRHSIKATSDAFTALPERVFETDGIHARSDVDVRLDLGATISGVVVDSHGKPVEDAHVSTGGGSARTDAVGAFVVRGLMAGDYEVSASTDASRSPETKLTLAHGGKAVVRLITVPSLLGGIVVDEQGEPVANAFVIAEHSVTERRRVTFSDDWGKFDYSGIEAGTYKVRAERRNMVQVDEPGIVTTTTTKQLRLVVQSESQIVGRVLLEGKPVTNFGVVVADTADAQNDPRPVRTPSGRFVFPKVGRGRWFLIVVGPEFVKKTIPIEVRGGTLDVGDLVVERGRTLTGRVVDELGVGVAHADVVVAESPAAELEDTLAGALGGQRVARTDVSGRYTISGLTSGTLFVGAHHARGLSPEVPLAVGVTTLDLVLARTGSIAGQLVNDDHQQWSVYAINGAVDPQRYRATIDGAGNFMFPRLLAGEYTLELAGRGSALDVRVIVTAGQRTTTQLVLLPPAAADTSGGGGDP